MSLSLSFADDDLRYEKDKSVMSTKTESTTKQNKIKVAYN